MDVSEKRLAFARDKLGFTAHLSGGPDARVEAGR